MIAVLHDVLPVFLLILTGYLAVLSGLMKAETGEALGEFVFRIAVPVLLFRTIAHADVGSGTPLKLGIAYFAGVSVAWPAAHLVTTRLFGLDRIQVRLREFIYGREVGNLPQGVQDFCHWSELNLRRWTIDRRHRAQVRNHRRNISLA